MTAHLKQEFKWLLERGLTQNETMEVLHLHGDRYSEYAAKINEFINASGSTSIEVNNTPLYEPSKDGVWVSAWIFCPDTVLKAKLP